jgi:hypothetical protein
LSASAAAPEDPLRQALRAALPAADALKDGEGKALALQRLGKAQARAGDRAAARATLGRAAAAAGAIPGPERRSEVVQLVAQALDQAGEPKAARALIDRLVRAAGALEGKARVHVLQRAGFGYADLKDRDAALGALRDALEACPDVSAVFEVQGALVSTHTRFGDYEGAIRAAGARPEHLADVPGGLSEIHLRSVATEAAKANGKTARAALARALEVAQELPEGPRGVALKGIAEAQAEAGDLEGALQTVHDLAVRNEMNSRDMAPAGMAKIAAAQAKAGDREGARATLQEALGLTHAIPDDNPNIKNNRFRAVAEGQAEVGDVAEALATIEVIRDDNNERAAALTTVAKAQAQAGDQAAARATFAKAAEAARAIKPRENFGNDDPAQNTAYALLMIAKAQAEVGALGDALATARSVTIDDWRLPLLAELAAEQAKAGDFTGALKTADSIPHDGLKTRALADVARAQAAAGDAAGALAWAARVHSPASQAEVLLGIAEGKAARKP